MEITTLFKTLKNVLGFKTKTPPIFHASVGLARRNRKSPLPISAFFANAALKYFDKSVIREANSIKVCKITSVAPPRSAKKIISGGLITALNRKRQKAEVIMIEQAAAISNGKI